MAEVEIRDSTIKLFGKMIALPRNPDDSGFKFISSEASLLKHCEKEISCEELASEKQENVTDETISEIIENPSVEREISSPKASKQEEQSETSMCPDNKTLKKADKILPCPRCNSTDTKFCYYNNYNVSQPRHFCKTCQRYWTAGGITRNVPVGAGRRKNKTSHFRQFLGNKNGTFLNFGDESSITASNSLEKESKITSQQSVVKNVIPFHSFNGLHWPYPSMASPPFNLPGFPVMYYTSPPSWTVINPQNSLTNSSVLGKRLRDGKSVKQSNCEKEPNINGGRLFGSFGQGAKGKEENYSESCSLLQANPAAFSRALKFREIV